MSNADNIFWRRFGAILVALSLFGVVVAFIARDIAGDSFRAAMNSPSAVADRLAQDGMVRVGDPNEVVDAAPSQMAMAPAAAPAAGSPAAGSDGDEGESVYSSTCVACHQAGVAGAPKLGDETAWAPRIATGEDVLVSSVMKGKGAMPPKGGNASLSEAQIKAAVSYMVKKSSPGGAAAAMPKMAKEAADGAKKAAAEKVMEKASDMAGKAKEKAADMATKATEKVTAAASTTMAAATPAASASGGGKPGAEVYNMGCVACHATGAANAPKLTDKAAWAPRVATGVDALIASAIKGKGAMPPKGGLVTLSDEDIGNAVRYMLKEVGGGG